MAWSDPTLGYFRPHAATLTFALVPLALHSAVPGLLVLLIERVLDDVLIAGDVERLRRLPWAVIGLYAANGLLGFGGCSPGASLGGHPSPRRARGLLRQDVGWHQAEPTGAAQPPHPGRGQRPVRRQRRRRSPKPLTSRCCSAQRPPAGGSPSSRSWCSRSWRPVVARRRLRAGPRDRTACGPVGLCLREPAGSAWCSRPGRAARRAAFEENERHRGLRMAASQPDSSHRRWSRSSPPSAWPSCCGSAAPRMAGRCSPAISSPSSSPSLLNHPQGLAEVNSRPAAMAGAEAAFAI